MENQLNTLPEPLIIDAYQERRHFGDIAAAGVRDYLQSQSLRPDLETFIDKNKQRQRVSVQPGMQRHEGLSS